MPKVICLQGGFAGPTCAPAPPSHPPPPSSPRPYPQPCPQGSTWAPSLTLPKLSTCGVVVGAEGAWEVEALPGPNAQPDYFTAEDIATFYSSTYKVHYNS